MAEFQEVMHQIARYCRAQAGCVGCKVYEAVGDHCPSDMLMTETDNCANIEKAVMSWAAEHPEPVYPTWCEYLQSIGVLGVERVPKDIAVVLGIKPKAVK